MCPRITLRGGGLDCEDPDIIQPAQIRDLTLPIPRQALANATVAMPRCSQGDDMPKNAFIERRGSADRWLYLDRS